MISKISTKDITKAYMHFFLHYLKICLKMSCTRTEQSPDVLKCRDTRPESGCQDGDNKPQ